MCVCVSLSARLISLFFFHLFGSCFLFYWRLPFFKRYCDLTLTYAIRINTHTHSYTIHTWHECDYFYIDVLHRLLVYEHIEAFFRFCFCTAFPIRDVISSKKKKNSSVKHNCLRTGEFSVYTRILLWIPRKLFRKNYLAKFQKIDKNTIFKNSNLPIARIFHFAHPCRVPIIEAVCVHTMHCSLTSANTKCTLCNT